MKPSHAYTLTRLAAVGCLCAALACNLPIGQAPPDSSAPSPMAGLTPSPTTSPTPAPALDPDAIWVGVEGLSDVLAEVSLAGAVKQVRVPLNQGQLASDLVASQDGRYLAYLVWDREDTQHGIAAWELSGPNARLVARPLPGYRIVSLYLADDATALAYVQVQEGARLGEADWRVDSVPVGGGEPVLLTERVSLGEAFPPTPIAWPEGGGPLLLNAAAPDGSSQGIYAASPQIGQSSQILPPLDTLIVAPTLSPDASRLAYLSHDSSLPDAPDDPTMTNVVRFYDLRLDQLTSMTPGAGRAVYGVRWHPDGRHVLLDMVAISAGTTTQFWVLVEVGQDPPWPETPPRPEDMTLFDYEPLGNGVVYTVLPTDVNWSLYIIRDIGKNEAPTLVSLDLIAREGSAPTIIRVP